MIDWDSHLFLLFFQGVNLPARLVIVKGTEYFDGKVSRYVDYPLTDVLQMIGRAGRYVKANVNVATSSIHEINFLNF